MNYEQLKELIQNSIEKHAKQNYQFVMLRYLLLMKSGTRAEIAKELANYNQNEPNKDFRYAGDVFEVLSDEQKNIVKRENDIFSLIDYDSLSEEQRYDLVSLCEEKIEWLRTTKNYGTLPTIHNMTFKDAALLVLKEELMPIHYVRICDIILVKHYVDTKGKTPHFTLDRDITADITNNPKSFFKKIEPGVFTINYDNFTFTVLSDEKEIEKTYQEFLNTLNLTKPKRGKITIAFPGPSEKVSDDVNWMQDFGFWWYSKKLPNETIPRYWNCFGIDEPKWNKANNIVLEINPPLRGIERHCHGAFVKDQDGITYITHDGVIGGGNTPGGFYDVYSKTDRWIQADDKRDNPRDLILLSPVTSSKLPEHLSEYILEVKNFKAGEIPKNESNSKEQFYLLLRHKSKDNPYQDDPSGNVYHFPKIPNYKKMVPGTKTIWFDRIGGTHYFLGYGIVSEVKDRADGDFDAKFNNFRLFEKNPESLELSGKYLKKASDTVQEKILALPGWNQNLSILQINKDIYDEIIGDSLNVSEEKFQIGHKLFKIELSQRPHKISFENFNHPDLLEDEINYKEKILANASSILSIGEWDEFRKTPGRILKAVRDATAVKISKNLVWAPPFSTEIGFFDELPDSVKPELENQLYDFFKGGSSTREEFGPRFNNLISFFEKNQIKYDLRLLSYLSFLLNPKEYFPIHPSNFDQLLKFYEIANIQEKSWKKYSLYLDLANSLKQKLLTVISEKDLNTIQIQSYMWVIARAISKNYWIYHPGSGGNDWTNQRNSAIAGIHYYTLNLSEYTHANGELNKTKVKDKIQQIRKEQGREEATPATLGSDYGQLETFFSIRKDDKIIAIGDNTTLLGIGDVKRKYEFRTDVGEFCHTVPVTWYDVTERTIPKQNLIRTIQSLDISDYVDIVMSTTQSENTQENSEFFDILARKKQFIFYGPPGTGKTYHAKIIAQEFVKKAEIDSLSDDEHQNYVLSIIEKIAIANGYDFHLEKNHVILKNQQNEIRLVLYGSKSGKTVPHDCYVGIWESSIEFLEKTKEENRFLLIINNDSKNFVIFPHKFIKENIKLSAGEKWDPSGTEKHSFHVHIFRDNARYRANDSSTESYVDCTNYLHNPEILFNKESKSCSNIEKITFHQSFSYEEFIEGIRPRVDKDAKQVTYPIEDGIFKKLCKCAKIYSKEKFVILIDEINRGNISKIFGELITLIEKDKRGDTVTLPYSKELFSVPDNLYIIGTMNTADRSLVHIDAALRRRFASYEMMPDPTILQNRVIENKINIEKLLTVLNKRILDAGMRENQIGHSYFMDNSNPINSLKDLQFVFAYEILPLLREYFYDDEKTLGTILGGEFSTDMDPTKPDWKTDINEFSNAVGRAFPDIS